MNQLATLVGIVCLMVGTVGSLFAQNPAIVPAPTATADRPATVGTDPTSANRSSLPIADDTVRVTPKQEAAIRKIIPRQATLRSLMLPGLGQAYNGQYYKIPFVYGGFGAVGYFFLRYRRLALEAENGYRQLLYGRLAVPAQSVNSVPGIPASITQTVQIPAQYEKVEQVLISGSVFRSPTQAKAAYDFYRRYRDLNIILSIVIYAVNAVEANVAAHLKTFDLSDDISMRIEPGVLPMPGTGLVPGVRVALTFK